jgi:subtilisin family serine protease
MHPHTLLLISRSAVLFAFFGLFALATASAQNPGRPYVQDEVLVKLRKGTSNKRSNDLFAARGASKQENLGAQGWVRVKLKKGQDLQSALAELQQNPEVEAVQPNFYYHLAATPNDPMWSNSALYGLTMISAPAAWDTTTGGPSVVVANIDTGMRYTHEDLAANMWKNPGEIQGNGFDDDGNGFADDYYGYDFFYNDPDPLDQHGHGTHTGGTIGAVGNNGLGVAGVNWNVKIMAIKIFSASGKDSTSAMLINAYHYIRMMKERGVNIRVTNNSYAGCDEQCGIDYATKEAIDAMGDAGILNVFAAGNNNQNNDTSATPNYPATYTSPSVLSVASSTSTDLRSGFSAYGVNSVDLTAPGSGVLSTTFASDSSYGIMSGTSMATPHVTGAAALLAAFDPSLSPASIKATLMNTVDTFASLGTTVEQNWAATPIRSSGRLNVARALQNRTVCSFDVSATTISARTKGGSYSVGVTAPQNCDFEIKRGDRWVHLDSDAGSGSGQVRFWIRVNPVVHRTTTLTVAGKTITVNQTRGVAN